MRDRRQGNTSSRFLDLLVLLRHQQLVLLLGDGGRAGQVRLDHVDEPGLVRGDAVSVEEPLEIGTELAGERVRPSSTGYAGVVVDGDAVPQGEIDAHRDGCIVAKGGSGRAQSGRCSWVGKRASPGRFPAPVELERLQARGSA